MRISDWSSDVCSSDLSNNSPFSGSSIVDLYDFDRGEFLDANTAAPKYRNKAFQYSLFAENRLELTDKWSVLGGLRYDHADVRRRDLTVGQQVLDKRFSNVGWRVGTVYDIVQIGRASCRERVCQYV